MFELRLTEQERQVLEEIVQSALATLEVEIHHAHLREFKDFLRHRREIVQQLSNKLPQAVATAA